MTATGQAEADLRPDADAERRLRRVSSLDEIDHIRAPWQAAGVTRADADIDFYLAFAASRDRFVRPYVLLLERGDEVEAMLVARVEDVKLAAKAGYRTLFSARMRAITVVHGGLAGITEENAGLFVEELERSLSRREADLLSLTGQPTGSPLYCAAAARIPAFRREPTGRPTTHRTLELPDTMDEFLRSRSKSTRESVKRYRKKVERDLGERLELRVYREPADIDRIFTETEPVAAQTYQRGLGVALADTAEQRALIEVGLTHGWFRTYVLALDGRTIAFWPGYAYGGTFFIGTPGYDPAFTDYRIGTYLQMRMFEDFVTDPGLHTVDYGFGDAEYKRRFGSHSDEEADLVAFAPAPRALAVHAVRSAILLGIDAGRALLERAGVLDRIKRGWRRRLATGSAQA